LEKGMTAYNRRAEGSIEDQANPKQINDAIEFFQFAMDESKVEAVVGLLKSYYFKGKYIAKTENEKKVIYNSAKELALENLDKYPKNVELHFWYLSNLGSWAEVYGILTAAKEGVADQMKDHALTIIELNPNYEDGGGYFMLGAVHYKSPYIPFFLSWPDNDEAIKWLKKANETGEAKPVQKVYLAQALYKNKEKSSAISLLEEVTNMTPKKVESLADWEQIKKARILLKEYR
jgi:tetratricopeptide (TPR) repeat protein